tara:strand:- start:357 stop:977 length:621 start_codon:yes stop_codon:yes gene_type:complete
MAYLIDQQLSSLRLKRFNGIRRTTDGMLYLSSTDPNSESDDITLSTFTEPGKSDLVPKDGETSYIEERLEMFNIQTYTGDNSTTSFTLNANIGDETMIAVFEAGVRKTAFTDFSVSGTTLTFVIPPANSASILVGQINKRYFNNNSDKYQQFVYNDNPTVTYLINSSGDLVKRINDSVSRTALTSDDFDTFEINATVNSTTYQSAY